MLVTHFKTALRSLQKNRLFSFINIMGLTVGLCACLLVSTVALDDLSYDDFWKRSDDLYRVFSSNKMGDDLYVEEAYTPIGLGTELKERFPEVENFSKVHTSELQLKPSDNASNGIKTSIIALDSNAVRMFDFDRLSGQLDRYVPGQQNLLITESFAKRFFKEEDPIGKVIYDVPTWQDQPTPYLVTAVIRDLPQNTHLRADAIVLMEPRVERIEKNRGTSNSQVYYLLKPGANRQQFEAKVNNWYAKHLDLEEGKVIFSFQPMRDIYLHSAFNNHQEIKSSIRSVYIFGSVGIFLLLIACINFINMSTARATQRLKESGIRKILGAERRQLMGQFLTESLLFFSLSTLLALLLYALSLPILERFLDHGLTKTVFANWPFFLSTLLFIFLLSLLTGAYPAILLSGFKPSNSLRGRFVNSSLTSSAAFRRILVVTQFSIAIITLVALLAVQSQLRFINQKDLGFNKEGLLYIDMVSWEGKGETIKEKLKQLPGVLQASITSWVPQSGMTSGNMSFEHPVKKGQQTQVNFIFGDLDFGQTIGLKLKSGRMFDRNFGTDLQNTLQRESDSTKKEDRAKLRPIMISESTAKEYGIDEAGGRITSTDYHVVGIIQDFHYESLHHSLTPAIIEAGGAAGFGGMFIRINSGQEQQVSIALHKIWRSIYQDKLLNTNWMSDILEKQYAKEQKQQTLFTFFSALMLFISSLGVFGLVLHAAEQRVKEIGIRKVLGASVSSIINLLSKDFVKLVLLAIVLASPIAWWAMNKWLEDFAYRIDLQWWMFITAGGAALFIALTTISGQAFKAATANPVDSLWDE
ncbi:ABC transporter permease [Olivibacter sp. SDN3]|uniref:ABC transporter permease n=1 Tax=Olivibacter sp. SDN3 TaxID=2764720 RepID=UPI001650DB8B|nr:FtsX-like permease family protein [Olivibacter sp. SDN3]QNL50950.1 ABC transporter permease [Olivibacter sp. SDN3]